MLVSVFDPSRDELQHFEKAIDFARATGDPVTIAQTRYWLGYMHYALGDADIPLS